MRISLTTLLLIFALLLTGCKSDQEHQHSEALSAVTLTVAPLAGGSGYTITGDGEINVDNFTFFYDSESAYPRTLEEFNLDDNGVAGDYAFARIAGPYLYYEIFTAVGSSFISLNVPEVQGKGTEHSTGLYIRQEDDMIAFSSNFFADDAPPTSSSIPVDFVWISTTGHISDWDDATFEWDSNGELPGGETISLIVIQEPSLTTNTEN